MSVDIFRRVGVLVVAASVVLGVGASVATAAEPAWVGDPVDVPVVANAELAAVSCPQTAFCVAVGSSTAPHGAQRALIESATDGGRWSTVPSPVPSHAQETALKGVSCASATACVAVGLEYVDGMRRSLIESWDGADWSLSAHPQPAGLSNGLAAVSCFGGKLCVAVGDVAPTATTGASLIERYNGTSWSIDTSADNPDFAFNALRGIDCVSKAQCYAVGTSGRNGSPRGTDGYGATLVEKGVNGAWHRQASPTPGGDSDALDSVSCTSNRFCLAVGSFSGAFSSGALAEQWDGRSWSTVTVPEGQTLGGVACTAPSFCVAGGTGNDDASSIEMWDGATFTSAISPGRGPLHGVACPSDMRCVAVGSTGRALIDTYDLQSWTRADSDNGRGNIASTLAATSCVSAQDCTAVGSYAASAHLTRTLIEHFDGTRWSPVPSPSPSATESELTSVACASASMCLAVGNSLSPNDIQEALVLQWDGTSWSQLHSPIGGALFGVSCPTTSFCMVSGDKRSAAWNDGTWTVHGYDDGKYSVDMDAVSCLSATDCTAVGSYHLHYSDTGVEAWDGTSWTLVHTPDAVPGGLNVLTGVSCASHDSCVAVGAAGQDGSVDPGSIVLTWDGTSWTLTDHPGSAMSTLAGVSCVSDGSCVAVGRAPRVLTRSGGTWRATANPRPVGAVTAPQLTGVDCVAAAVCRAVGVDPRAGGDIAYAVSVG